VEGLGRGVDKLNMIGTRRRRKIRLEDFDLRLPEQVCVIDIELESGDVRNPNTCIPSLVGVLPFILKRGRYTQKHPTIIFLHDEEHYQLLEKYLASFSGIVIGHNILGFDYKVLKKFINLRGIVEKSVDTLDLLASKCKGKRWGLSLNNLSEKNLYRSKKHKGSSISDLWNSGQGNEVIDYNIEDCKLTFKLWYLMVKKQLIVLDDKEYAEEWQNFRRKLAISFHDLEILVGKSNPVTYANWLRKSSRKKTFIPLRKYSSYTH
jgi:hypothetical protein